MQHLLVFSTYSFWIATHHDRPKPDESIPNGNEIFQKYLFGDPSVRENKLKINK